MGRGGEGRGGEGRGGEGRGGEGRGGEGRGEARRGETRRGGAGRGTHQEHTVHGLGDIECVAPVVVRHISVVLLHSEDPATKHL